MRFVLPSRKGLRPRWLLRLGLFLYDHIGGRELLPPTQTIRLGKDPAGAPLKPEFAKAFEYSDGWVDDARLVVLNAMDAASQGAQVHTRTPLTGARREGDLWVIETPAGEFRAKALVNAAGPGVLDVLGAMGEAGRFGVRRVRGSHIVVKKLFDHDRAYFFQLPDTRIFFAIPYEREFTLIGTTDADHDGPLDQVHASEAEIAYLCEGVNGYFRQQIGPEDVVWTYAGVRALIDDGSGRPEAATRGYRLALSEPGEGAPLLTVFGGKITSYRHLAEEAVDMLGPRLDALTGEAWTASEPLPGGDFPVQGAGKLQADLRAAYPLLSEVDAQRIGRAYGTLATRWLGEATSWDDLGKQFGAGLTEAEINWMRDAEWARTAEDVLWRRSKLGLHMSEAERAAVAAFMEA
jgi:glycerol-3-phosphate dehydrogenase